MRASHTLNTVIRFWMIAAVLMVAVVLVVGRAVYLHVLNTAFLQHQGDARTIRKIEIPAIRGMILDRNGEPLAVSVPIDSVWVNPKVLLSALSEVPRKNLVALSQAIDIPLSQVMSRIKLAKAREFAYLKRHVEPEVAKKIKAVAIPGVFLKKEYRRYYPEGEVASHLVGFTNIDDRGLEGLEFAYDTWLRGEMGAKRVLQDRLGRVVSDLESLQIPREGQDLVLSIDRRLQYVAYLKLKEAVRAFHAKSGSVVMLDVASGEVLALANQPSFNPNNRQDRQSDHYRNRAVTDLFEPGSTIKPFAAIAALGSGLYTPHTPINTHPGWITVSGKVIRDHHNLGLIDVTKVVQKSSNVGITQIALTLPPKALWQIFSDVGFGAFTGSGLPGENSGVLPGYQEWQKLEQATLAFGYGLSVTALQLSRAYAVIASGGVSTPISVVRMEHVPEGQQLISAPLAEDVKQMLTSVVSQEGTGSLAKVFGYHVAGKTGTVRKAGKGGYTEDNYIAVFAGMAPVQAPRVVLVVVIEEPRGSVYYGGQVAAPVFSSVMGNALRFLNVPPDNVPADMRVARL
ncbi:MAG: penicillin-binding protein 2 [Gammaproteobacteria bacterium]|nr:penicillin-binding protein 2 [Gammaproteobacteria bacterium]